MGRKWWIIILAHLSLCFGYKIFFKHLCTHIYLLRLPWWTFRMKYKPYLY